MTKLLLLAPFLAAFAVPGLHAQTASYTISGSACTTGRISPIGPIPLAVRGLPRLGQSFEVITECSANYPWGNRRRVALLTGLSNTMANGVPLPFDVAMLAPGEPFCGLLQTSAEVVAPLPLLPDYQAPVAIRFDVPASPSLLGLTLYQQVLSMESSTFGPPFRSLALSALGRAVIGL